MLWIGQCGHLICCLIWNAVRAMRAQLFAAVRLEVLARIPQFVVRFLAVRK